MNLATSGKDIWGSGDARLDHWATGNNRILFDVYKPARYRRNLPAAIISKESIDEDLGAAVRMYMDGNGKNFRIRTEYK
jgi:hypothetical protein